MFLKPSSLSPADMIGVQHLDGLYYYALTLTRNHAEAEDLVQETYVRAIGGIASLRDETKLKSWLFTILRNIWFNQLQKRRTAPQFVEMGFVGHIAETNVEASYNPHAIYVNELERRRVREAIQQLPTEFREVILLREYEGLSYQEIATVLDCPPGTVMSRLARARSKLRTLILATQQILGQEERELVG